MLAAGRKALAASPGGPQTGEKRLEAEQEGAKAGQPLGGVEAGQEIDDEEGEHDEIAGEHEGDAKATHGLIKEEDGLGEQVEGGESQEEKVESG